MSGLGRLANASNARSTLLALAGLSCILATAVISASSHDLITDSWDWSGATLGGLAWPSLGVVAACSAVHYVAAAVATQAATSRSLQTRETVLVQLCAATANKLTPAGLGGSAVLARYLHRRAGLSTASAAGTVSVIALGRAAAALLTLGVLDIAGPWFGLDGGSTELARLVRETQALLVAHPWLLLALVSVAAVSIVLAVRARSAARRFAQPLRDIVRSPGPALTILAASAAQTLVLGGAFAAAVSVLPGTHPSMSTGALIVGYIAATAAAAAVPLPGGIGSGEAALTAVLVSGHVGLGHAGADVLLFRIMTLWLPAAAGLPCARVLRQRSAL